MAITILPETLNRLTPAAMAHIYEIVRDEPGDEGERGALVLTIVADILGRMLACLDQPRVAYDVNATFAAHNLPWRIVWVS